MSTFHASLREDALRAARSRLANGYFSERQLARVARVSQPHLHNVLCGKRAPSAQVLDRICDAAGVELVVSVRLAEHGWWE